MNQSEKYENSSKIFQPELPHEVLFAMLSVYSLIFSAGVLSNGLLITAITMRKKLHKPTNMLIVNLALSDLVTSLLLVPIRANNLLGGQLFGEWLSMSWSEMVFPCSLHCLTLMSLEKLVIIFLPLRTNTFLCKSNVGGTIVMMWTYTLISTLLLNSLNLPHAHCVHLTLNVVVPLVFVVGVDVNLFVASYQQVNRTVSTIGTLGSKSTQPTHTMEPSVRFSTGKVACNQLVVLTNKLRRASKAGRRIGTMTSVVVVCWTPYVVVAGSQLLCRCYSNDGVSTLVDLINCAAAVFNPFLYGWCSKNIRRKLLK